MSPVVYMVMVWLNSIDTCYHSWGYLMNGPKNFGTDVEVRQC